MSPLHQRIRRHAHWYVGIVVLLLAFGLGLFVGGGNFTLRKKSLDLSGKGVFEQVLTQTRESARREVPFELYWEIWDKLEQKFAGGEPDDVALFYSSLAGLVAGLDDPYSVFLAPETAMAFIQDLSGSFEGIGAEIGIKGGMLMVIAPLPGSPAERSGVMAGDIIVAIDDKDSFELSLDEAVNAIRGKRGTVVRLRVRRNGFETEEEIDIMRGIIDIQSVEWKMVDIPPKERGGDAGSAGYIKINHFNEETWDAFNAAVAQVLGSDPKGLILDLRNNPGGFLETAVTVASEWIAEGKVVVIEKGRQGEPTEYPSAGAHRFLNVPTVVLVNEGSASASEIVAGALQDYRAAVVVGTQTFGKGSVQDFEILQDGSALKLTIAEWLTPKGRHIHELGITPDRALEEQEVEVEVEVEADDREDIYLTEALSILSRE